MGSEGLGGEAVWPDSSPKHCQPCRLAPGFLPGVEGVGVPTGSPQNFICKDGQPAAFLLCKRQTDLYVSFCKLGSLPTQDRALCPPDLG